MPPMPPRPDFAPNAEVYDEAYYAAMYRPHWLLRNARKYRERDAALLAAVRPHARMRLLEVGSARGDTAFFFASRVAEVVGIDAAGTAVAVSRAAAAARGLTNVLFETADARDLAPFGNGSFDAVLLADFVEHVTDEILRPCLAEALRVLSPGGALGIYTPNRDHWAERIKAGVPGLQQADHIAVRSSAEVVRLVAESGFLLDELSFTASPYPLLGGLDRLFPRTGLCRFRTVLRALAPG